MRQELKRQSGIKVKSWINDKPISTADWEVFGSVQGESEYVILAREEKTGNQLKIIITQYHENFEEINQSGNEVPESK
jgi:hypothetical protein